MDIITTARTQFYVNIEPLPLPQLRTTVHNRSGPGNTSIRLHMRSDDSSSESSNDSSAIDSTEPTMSATTRQGEIATKCVSLLCRVYQTFPAREMHFNFTLTELYGMLLPVECPEMKNLRDILQQKYEKRTDSRRAAFIKTLGKSYDPSEPTWAQELRSQYMRQVFRLSISLELYRRRLPVVFQYFERMFVKNRMASGYVLTGTFIQQKYQARVSNKRTNFPMKIATPIQALFFFHALVFVSRNVPHAPKNAHVGNRVGYVVQMLCSCWENFVTSSLKANNFLNFLVPYMCFDDDKDLFVPISTREEGYGPSTQLKDLMQSNATTGEDNVCAKARARSDEEDKSIRAVVALFFTHLHECLKDTDLYDQSDTSVWERKTMYQKLGNNVPSVFTTLDEDVCKLLGITHHKDVVTVLEDSPGSNSGSTKTASAHEPDRSTISSPAPFAAPSHAESVEEQPVSQDLGRRQMPKRVRFSIPVKEEDEEDVIIVEDEPPSKRRRLVGISPAEKKTLRDFMENSKHCYLFNDSFENFHDCVHESSWSNRSLRGKVQLILTDPPYNVRRESTRDNAEYDSLSLEDMRQATYLFAELLRPGGHGIVFCSMRQFSQWYDLLSNYRRNQKAYDEEEALKDAEDNRGASSDSAPNIVKLGRPIFHVDPAGIHMVRAKGHYNNNPFWKNKNLRNGVEHAIHFQKKVKKSQMDNVIRKPLSTHSVHVKSTHPTYVNVIDNVKFAPREILYKPVQEGENSGPGRKPMLRPEQKSENLMKHFITEHTKPGCIVVDLFGGTFSTARACMSLSEPRIFFGCEQDPDCFIQAEEYVMDAFYKSTKGSRNPMQLDTTLVKPEVESFLKYMDDRRALQRIGGKASQAPKGLPQYQLFPQHVVEFVSTTMQSNYFYNNCSRLRFDQWPDSAHSAMEVLGVNTIRAAEAVKYQLRIGTSKIRHERAGVGVFTNRDIFEGTTVCCFYGSILYGPMPYRTYGTGVMSAHPSRYSKYAMQVPAAVKDNEGNRHKVIHIIPAPFCVAGFINDPKYNEGDLDYPRRNLPTAREGNVEIVSKVETTVARSALQQHDMLTVRSIRNIKAGEELYISYGDKYPWEDNLSRPI